MTNVSKRYQALRAKVDPAKTYPAPEALLVKMRSVTRVIDPDSPCTLKRR